MIASSASDRDGQSYNVNADEAAGKVAAALGAYKAIFLTDVEGWLADAGDEASLISRATVAEVEEKLAEIDGGMRPKLAGLRRRDPAAAPSRPTSSTAASRTACCWSCSPTPASARWSRREPDRAPGAEERYLMRTYRRAPVEFVRGEGALLWDAEGREYLDFLTGISVCSVGHCHPAVVEAVREQAGRLMHVSNLFYTEPMVRLAERLAESSLGGRVFFSNSGTEANECAIKVARKHAHRRGIAEPEIVSFEGDFHGRTYGALAATPELAANRGPGPDAARLPLGAAATTPTALRDAVGERTAAVLIEPIQGEAGVYPISDEALLAAREACDEAGALLILDEIQTGMGQDRVAVGLRADPGAPRRDDHAPRRSAAACRSAPA